MERLARILPAFEWLPDYNKKWLRGDLSAGLTVGVIAVPQVMAYAMLAGVPPIHGLYASLVPLIVYALMGTSRQLASGPVATSLLIIAAGLAGLAEPFSPEYVGLVLLTTLMVGLTQVVMGVFRLGFIVNFLSRPVIVGFMTAAPLIIASSQIGNLLGLELTQTQYITDLFVGVFAQFSNIDTLPLGIGMATIAIMLGIEFFKPSAPSALVVMVLGIVAAWALNLEAYGLEVVGKVPAGLPAFVLPTLDLELMRKLIPTSLTVALEQCMVVMSLGAAFAAKHKMTVRPNKELIAVGAANTMGSFFGGVPVSGSFSRSAVNDQAGAKTPLANLISAGVVALTLMFFTPLFYHLPIAVLAAVIVVVALKLINIPQIRYLLKTKRRDAAVAFLTFGATLVLGIQTGILLGVAASVFLILWRISRPEIHELGRVPGTDEYRSLDNFSNAKVIPGIYLLRVDSSLSFANAETIRQKLLEPTTSTGKGFKVIILDATGINDLDTTSATMLAGVSESLGERQIELYIAGAKGPVRETIERSGLDKELGKTHFSLTVDEAVQRVQGIPEGDATVVPKTRAS
ncbi:SulP family inorganic anion transporter [Bradymonas sediminis]|uniref:SulP family inorganic anion transporter n=1 Tax=Bradymonas sediminis TaxID=1548548 RepID=UPI0010DCA577|nr:sulfate permease [Bradymonas sediminis]TDP77204.1 SulP family sulfate permease [Bradymonas sediminis]